MMAFWRQTFRVAAIAMMFAGLALAAPVPARAEAAPELGTTQDVGKTGFAVRRPVFAGACSHACPWGEIADFVREAMKPLGYDVVICRNCNRDEGPRLVSKHALPPALNDDNLRTGVTVRINAPADFGVTESGMLGWAYEGKMLYAREPAFTNLRLIARIEDPTFMLVAVRAETGISDLAEIREKRLPVRILSDGQPASRLVLAHYGLTEDAVRSWGGSFIRHLPEGGKVEPVDVIVSPMGSPANNPESAFWSALAATQKLRFLDLPAPLLDRLVSEAGMQRVLVRWGFLPGIDREIATVGRSGEAIFTTSKVSDEAAYDVARAIDMRRNDLIWFVRPYSYDPRTVAANGPVPLHPGAARYYREAGYIK